MFSSEKWKEVDHDGRGSGEELGEAEEGEILIKIYYIKIYVQ